MTFTATFRDPTYAGIDDLVCRVLDLSGVQIGDDHPLGLVAPDGVASFAILTTLPITYRLPEHWPAPEAEEGE